jgi:hypothetical protein
VVRQPSTDGSWRSFTPLAALLLLDVDTATPASERPTTALRAAVPGDAKISPGTQPGYAIGFVVFVFLALLSLGMIWILKYIPEETAERPASEPS